MRFDVKKLEWVDENAKNIFRVVPPYYLLSGNSNSDGVAKKKVIFFGSCFKNLPRDVNLSEYVKITNQCLDFVRRECAGCDLYYKPHPAETDESKSLNLNSFEIEKDKAMGEVFLYKNLDKIKYVFSSHSTISVPAFSFGLNSYVFAKLFKSSFGEFTKKSFEGFLKGMPENYYIFDLNKKLEENKLLFAGEDFLSKQWAGILANHKGTVWFVADDPSLVLSIFAFVKLIRSLAPGRKIGMVIGRHERWDLININDLKANFDELVFLPIVRYTMRPSMLYTAIKTALTIKRFKIKLEDIIFGFGPEAFPINCFASYFKKNLRIGLIPKTVFYLNHNFNPPLNNSDFSIKATRLFFINFMEPFLGLYKTIGRLQRHGDRGGFGIGRYQSPLNEVFDIVYISKYIDETKTPVVDKVW